MKKIKSLFKQFIYLIQKKQLIPIPIPTNCMQLLEGKVALITGGSSGIGLAIAEAFINCGCKVIISGSNQERLELAYQKLKLIDNLAVAPLILDVRQVECMPMKIRESAKLFDENKIDILVNSAGIGRHTEFGEITEDEWDAVMEINAKGTFFMCQAMGNYMKEHGIRGHILNIASSSSLRPACAPYLISKWSVRGMTLGIADKLAPYGIVVNAIAPGPVATPLLGIKEGDSIYNESSPVGRYGTPSEIAALATFMVSNYGDLIIGDTFFITGGSGVISLHK